MSPYFLFTDLVETWSLLIISSSVCFISSSHCCIELSVSDIWQIFHSVEFVTISTLFGYKKNTFLLSDDQ